MYTTIIATRQPAATLHPDRWMDAGQLIVTTGEPGTLHIAEHAITDISGQPASDDTLTVDATFKMNGDVYRVMAFLTPWYD